MKYHLITLTAALGLAASAYAAPASGVEECFESGFIYSRGSGDMSDYDAMGMTVAAGWRQGNHKLQLQVSALAGEGMDRYTLTGSPVGEPTLQIVETIKGRLDHVPVWVNYRYGFSFGPAEKARFEFGPTAGVRVQRFYTTGHVTTTDTTTNQVTADSDYKESSGALSFDYGVGGSLSYAFNKNWRLIGGLSYIMTTHADFRQEIKPASYTKGSTTYELYSKYEIDAHATTYGSLTLEYTF